MFGFKSYNNDLYSRIHNLEYEIIAIKVDREVIKMKDKLRKIDPDYNVITNGTKREGTISSTTFYIGKGEIDFKYTNGHIEEINVEFSGTLKETLAYIEGLTKCITK